MHRFKSSTAVAVAVCASTLSFLFILLSWPEFLLRDGLHILKAQFQSCKYLNHEGVFRKVLLCACLVLYFFLCIYSIPRDIILSLTNLLSAQDDCFVSVHLLQNIHPIIEVSNTPGIFTKNCFSSHGLFLYVQCCMKDLLFCYVFFFFFLNPALKGTSHEVSGCPWMTRCGRRTHALISFPCMKDSSHTQRLSESGFRLLASLDIFRWHFQRKCWCAEHLGSLNSFENASTNLRIHKQHSPENGFFCAHMQCGM